MRKIILLLVTLIAVVSVNAQETEVKFNLTRNGSFVAPDGKDFVIVPFEGKTQQELYTMVKSNIMTFYKSPKDVLNENEPTTITIRAITNCIGSTYKIGIGALDYYAYYNLTFHFNNDTLI